MHDLEKNFSTYAHPVMKDVIERYDKILDILQKYMDYIKLLQSSDKMAVIKFYGK